MAAACAGAVAVYLVAALGCSASRPANEDTTGGVQQEIQNGQPDTSHRFAVGVCNGSPGRCIGICSGALVLPNVVATARHCVDATPKTIDCSTNPTFGARNRGSVYITTNASMKQGGSAGWYQVGSVAVPSDDHICGNDLALLVLTKSVPASDAAPITPGVQYPMWDDSRYQALFTAIGYGVTAPNNDDSQTRRIRKYIAVQCIPGSESRPCPAEAMKVLSPKEFWGGSGTCSGDSGSSAFEANSLDKGAAVSFGVLSRGGELDTANGEGRCTQSFYTRFDAHRDFVLDVAKAASKDWTLYPEPSWTAYMPPPTPKKDAGVEVEEAGVEPSPPALELGEKCSESTECKSDLCIDTDDGSRICSTTCDDGDEASCADGYTCQKSVCVPATEAGESTPVIITKTSSACASSPGSSAPSWVVAVVVSAVVLAAARRRRP